MKGHQCRVEREEGQSIVILALAMVGLLVFAGLAVDAGVIYVTSVRLKRAVDAAALAGVVELPYESSITSTDLADARAEQFLEANEIEVDITDAESFESSRQSGVFGTYRYLITATHQADLYFLPLVNFRYIILRDSAVSEYNPLVSLYTSQTGIYGQEQTSNLSIFGPRICTAYGDAYTPYNSQWYDELNGIYHFRLDIPAGYEGTAEDLTRRWNEEYDGVHDDTNDIVRGEIWDPDCYNTPLAAPPNPNQIVITNAVSGSPETVAPACTGNDYERKQPCTPETGQQANPFWFVRIDENRGHGTAPGDGQCDEPGSYDEDFNTTTEYTLYYFRKRGDGSVQRRDLARYTKGGAESDSDTDMLWVSPGGSLSDDPLPDGWLGSPYGFTWDAGDGSFEVDINPDSPTCEVSDIYVSPVDGKRSLFLDVRGVEGASENGFDLWGGPRYRTVPSEVNARNLDIYFHPGDYHSSAGATFFGIGHLPMNSNHSKEVTLTLAYVPPSWAGRKLYVRAFDNDAGAQQVKFIFDTMPKDWEHIGQLSGNDVWYNNEFTVPSEESGHTFYGGFLQAIYDAGGHDTFGWMITGEAIPTLAE